MAIGVLRALWDEGHSTAEIGWRMGLSKNAVVGKAHRLNLRARPSPICACRHGEGSPRPVTPSEAADGRLSHGRTWRIASAIAAGA